jgi:hypothetical protein
MDTLNLVELENLLEPEVANHQATLGADILDGSTQRLQADGNIVDSWEHILEKTA